MEIKQQGGNTHCRQNRLLKQSLLKKDGEGHYLQDLQEIWEKGFYCRPLDGKINFQINGILTFR